MTSLPEITVPDSAAPQPLPPGAALPHRKVIRSWLLPLAQRSTWRALALLAMQDSPKVLLELIGLRGPAL